MEWWSHNLIFDNSIIYKNITVKTFSKESIILFLEQFHQHSSLPPVVIPHLGWDWRIFKLLSGNIGTSEKMNTCRNSCVIKAASALPRINIGLVKILIFYNSVWKRNMMTGGSNSGSTMHKFSDLLQQLLEELQPKVTWDVELWMGYGVPWSQAHIRIKRILRGFMVI